MLAAIFARTACLVPLLVAACAVRHPPPPAPASVTAPIDGAYKGLATGSCGASEARAVVRDGHLTLSVEAGPDLQGTAQPGGVLRAAASGDEGGDVTFAGRIDGTELRGGSYNGRCAFAFALNRA